MCPGTQDSASPRTLEMLGSKCQDCLELLRENMAGLSTTVGAQGVAKIINPFDGSPKDFKE